MSHDIPETRNESLEFKDLFDIEKIQMIQDSFAKATGVASIITDIQGNPITKPSNFCRLCNDIIRKTDVGLRNCLKSDCVLGRENDSGPIVQPCLSGGLWDGGASIRVGGKHIANWLIGQVRNETQVESELIKYSDVIGVDKEEFSRALKEVTIMSETEFRNICNFLYLMANQLSELAYKNVQQANSNREKRELQEKLNQKNKMDAIGQLAGGVAHDFNNQLMGIMGAAQLLDSPDRKLDKESRKMVNLIIKISLRSADLIKKLMSFSRKGDRLFEQINIYEVLGETVEILERSINKKIKLKLSSYAENCWIQGNAADLQNSFLNLGINASHAIEKGGIIQFLTENLLLDQSFCDRCVFPVSPGEYVKITVKDNGSGISPEKMDKIFEPFYTTNERGRGTGLGLSTVYGIVKNHKGMIDVSSIEGEGTEFYIYIPVSENPDKKKEIASEALSETGKGVIFFIDDEQYIIDVFSPMLKQLGYVVVSFKSGVEALRHFSAEPYAADLVITDMMMPELSGMEIFYRMKELNPRCPIIVSSGYSKNEDIDLLIKDGLAGFIKKPFTINEISSLIHSVLN